MKLKRSYIHDYYLWCSSGSEEIQQVEQNRESEAAESSRKAKVTLNDAGESDKEESSVKEIAPKNNGKRKTKPPLNSLAILHDAGVPIDTSLDKLCQQLCDGVFLKPNILVSSMSISLHLIWIYALESYHRNCVYTYTEGETYNTTIL